MVKKYNCNVCNYETSRLSDIKKHFKTKKHLKKSKINTDQSCRATDDLCRNTDGLCRKSSKNGFICEYCEKFYKDKSHKNRHYKNCNMREKVLLEREKKQIEETKLKLEQQKLEMEMRQKEMEEKNKLIEQEKNDIIRKFSECLMKIYEEKSKPQIINNIQNINVEQLTIRYVRKHFNEAYNYEDLMEPLLTKDEIKLIEESPINGCYSLLKQRCIDNIDINKRPIHLVDQSRNKYALRKNGQWVTDKGDEILKVLDKKVSWLIKQYDLNDEKERDQQLTILQSILSDKYRILDYLNDDVLLKSNVKLIK
jgi:hypothetical protein